MTNTRFLLTVVVTAFLSACNGCFGCDSPVNRPGSNLPNDCVGAEAQAAPQKLDVLFVIDNSGSMKEEQEGVARELTAFVNELRVAGGVSQDFRVGVITTSVYQHTKVNGVDGVRLYDREITGADPQPAQAGRLQRVPNATPDGGVVLGTGTERVLFGDDPDLVPKFARLVQVGTKGSGQETPFEAIRRALSEPLASTAVDQGGTKGFLRDGSRLLIVVLTDEEDCSEADKMPGDVTLGNNKMVDDCTEQSAKLTPVADYHDFLTQQLLDGEGNHREIIYTAIAPVGRATKAAMLVVDNSGDAGAQVRNIDCPTSNGPGTRHRQMAEAFYSATDALENIDSICKDSYRDTLVNIATLAGVSQVLELDSPIPDPRLLKVEITRRDDSVQICTLSNGGLESFDLPNDGEKGGRVHFGATCKRRRDDKAVQFKLLCAT